MPAIPRDPNAHDDLSRPSAAIQKQSKYFPSSDNEGRFSRVKISRDRHVEAATQCGKNYIR
jgi:hypothetical protein